MFMRRLLLVLLAAGCNEHGSSPPDAFAPDAKLFLDAQVTTCFAPAGSANVTATPSDTFDRVYIGGVFGSGPFARTAHVAPNVLLVITNAPSAGFELTSCTGGAGCPIEGLFVSIVGGLEPEALVGSHRASIERTQGGGAAVEGVMNITEFVDPFDSLPGHLTGTVSATTPSLTVNGSFSSVFCPPYMMVLI